ncbi:MAG: carbohydrate kinase family protein [Vicinamibacteria bacterium]|nr:carbohydrate kinase family protein [Vicinamibacteria bacterium]
MSTIDLACVGESFEDLIFAGLPRLPRLGEELRTKSFVRTYGGGATITAVAAARLGVPTRIVSGLSDGALARLRAEGVQITNLRKRDELHAITAALSTPENRAFATFDGVNAELGPRFVTALGRVQARIVHCALCPRDIPPMARALRALRERGVKVSLDFGYDLHLAKDPFLPSLIAEADYLLINEDEAVLYAKRRTLAQAASFWREHARHTVIKLGAKGSLWISPRGIVEEAAPKVQAVDTTGAGDAFNAGFLAGLLNGLPARRALRLGNTVGARSTRAVGGLDGLPRIEEL